MKPVEEDRLNASLIRARRLLSSDSDRQQEVRRLTHAIGQRPSMEQIVGKKKERFFLLRPEEIYFFIAEDGLVKLSTLRETYTVALTLNDLENALATKHFFRVHRSALLNLNRIREIQPYFRSSYIILMGDQLGTEFQVSERQAKHLRELIPGL